ncbi:MAG: hypothetical protein GXO86_04290 [Chlorobi bacterium]|nr:hypothetical protein [Chlorobiota bacterium]
MIFSLFIISLFFTLFGVYSFLKRKPVLGWFFLVLGIFGFMIGGVVISLYPDTLWKLRP